jgi:class 3 adenylate cyclase
MAATRRTALTFLFTDVEGSTRLMERHPRAYGAALLRHDAIVREAVDAGGGRIFETLGDGVYAAFPRPAGAVKAAFRAQTALAGERWGEVGTFKVRMALHPGPVEPRGAHYYGPPLYRCARILALLHGGQVVLSAAAARAGLPPGAGLLDLGEHRLRDLSRPERLFQLLHPDLPAGFPPLRSAGAGAGGDPPAARWQLRVRDPSGAARVVPLVESTATIGRSPACTVWLDSPYASRQHARIELHPDGPVLTDLGSRNGSHLNGRRVERSARLRGGDVITIADAVLECVERTASGTATLIFGPGPGGLPADG